MNPPVSKGVDYDQGFRDGYHQREVDQITADLFRVKRLTPDDLDHIINCLKSVGVTVDRK